MNVVARRTLVNFWTKHPASQGPLEAWFSAARAATWKTPQDIRDQFGSADSLADNRVVFNIGGNNYRLTARVSYTFKQVMVKFVGTHREYDDLKDAGKI